MATRATDAADASGATPGSRPSRRRPGLGVVERGAIAARDGPIVFAGPEADCRRCATRRASIATAAGSRRR